MMIVGIYMRKMILSIMLIFSMLCKLQAQTPKYLPTSPNPPRLVSDLAHMLTPAQADALENKLKIFSDSSTNQVAVVTVDNLQDRDIETYANELFRAWGIGGKENNGVLLLIAKEDRKTRIEVGYGLEGALPDLVANEILDYDLTPNFRIGNFYKGIDDATDNIIAATQHEYKADPNKVTQAPGAEISAMQLLFLMLIIFLLLRAMSRRNNKYYMSRRGHRGWDDDGFGGGFGGGFLGGGGFFDGGGGGGFGGGGFGGFGGGSSGGGGASGSW